jgi:hypothetical protein
MPKRKSSTTTKGSKAKKAVETEEDETPSEPIEEYAHGSLAKGDTPPPWVARAIADTLRDNPYRDIPQDELEVRAKELYQAVEELRLVERVLQARNAAW